MRSHILRVLGGLLALAAVLGLCLGARLAFHIEEVTLARTVDGVVLSHEGRTVSGLVIGYGGGLLPLVVGMLLWERSLAGRSAWLALLAALVALPTGSLWLARAKDLFLSSDAGWLPALFLGLGLAAVVVWSGALVIRARRRRADTG